MMDKIIKWLISKISDKSSIILYENMLTGGSDIVIKINDSDRLNKSKMIQVYMFINNIESILKTL